MSVIFPKVVEAEEEAEVVAAVVEEVRNRYNET